MPELQHEVIVADHAVGLETTIHLCEVYGTLPLMNLHGIPATQRDVWARFPGQVYEFAITARAAA
jgi:hypothetical protein